MDTLLNYSKNQLSKIAITFKVVDENGLDLTAWDSRIEFDEQYQFPTSFQSPQITLPIYPTDIVRSQPIRTELTPSVMFDNTFSPNAVTQNWGAGLPKWTIKGHTGYCARTVEPLMNAATVNYLDQNGNTYNSTSNQGYMDGYLTFLALYRFFECYAKMNILRLQDSPPKQSYQMVFINWSDKFQDWWYVEPTKFPDKIRSADKSLWYFYDIELTGIKPYITQDKVFDDVSVLASDAVTRLGKAGLSMQDSLTSLNSFDMSSIPSAIKSSCESIKSNLTNITTNNMLYTNLQQATLICRSTLSEIDSTVNVIRLTVKNVLSPLFDLMHEYKQLRCVLSTILALPLDLYTSAYDVINSLVDALKASGCGTTLLSGNANLGYYSLQK